MCIERVGIKGFERARRGREKKEEEGKEGPSPLRPEALPPSFRVPSPGVSGGGWGKGGRKKKKKRAPRLHLLVLNASVPSEAIIHPFPLLCSLLHREETRKKRKKKKGRVSGGPKRRPSPSHMQSGQSPPYEKKKERKGWNRASSLAGFSLSRCAPSALPIDCAR